MPLVFVDCETTGLKAGFHDIIQFACIALKSNFDIDKTINPFYMFIKQKRPENVDPKAMEINKISLDEVNKLGFGNVKAIELFEEWAAKFQGKLHPIAHNYPFDKGFMIDWLGTETMENLFDYHYRDSQAAAEYINDRQMFQNGKPVFDKVNLRYLCKQLNVPYNTGHDALNDCVAGAQVYKKMIELFPGM